MGNKQTIFTDEQLDAYQVRYLRRPVLGGWESGRIPHVWAGKQRNV